MQSVVSVKKPFPPLKLYVPFFAFRRLESVLRLRLVPRLGQVAIVHPGCISSTEPPRGNVPPALALTTRLNGAGESFRLLDGDVRVSHESNQIVSRVAAHQAFAGPMIGQRDLMNHPALNSEWLQAPCDQHTRLNFAACRPYRCPAAVHQIA